MRSLLSPGIKLFAILLILAVPQWTLGFSFSQEDEKEANAQASRSAEQSERVAQLMSIPCKDELREKKIAVVIGERHNDTQMAGRISMVQAAPTFTKKRSRVAVIEPTGRGSQANYGVLFNEINQRLRDIGLKTYSEAEISAQVAQAEMEAFLNNDMDAAASAANRLSAHFFLRGVIDSRSQVNPVLGINEVFVTMAFTLVDASGRIISNVAAKGDAYSGQDTLSVALALVREQADLVVARLYHDYCIGKSR